MGSVPPQKGLFSAVLSSLSTMETTDSFGGADSVYSRSRASSSSSQKSQSRQLTSGAPSRSRPKPSNMFSSAPSPSPSASSSSIPRQSSPAWYRSTHAESPDPSNFNVSSVPSPSRFVSLPASPSTGGSIDASSPTTLSVHSLRSNTQYSHRLASGNLQISKSIISECVLAGLSLVSQ